ncbi:PREDICTED: uncharacterized protein LOC106304572 isoform X2 [Brassica oleracea var. oleracea]|uniref:uncharacterized protein LOC106304572 isoform X2 n=1 Tax=Brassica oleracea var. oleracea TaxID=109376 RepID=UPI0006A7043D|nr:PREDICTED: uncharacterized protein LOC106304572 isoform X2 [Brassica oleracea var. oleracea]
MATKSEALPWRLPFFSGVTSALLLRRKLSLSRCVLRRKLSLSRRRKAVKQILDSNDTRWISQPFSTPDLIEQRNLHRAISYPEPQHHQRPHQHQQQFSSEPIILPKSSGGDRKISM